MGLTDVSWLQLPYVTSLLVQTRIAPPRRTQPTNEETKYDDDDDVVSVDYTIGRPSIGLGSGRAMRPQPSMVLNNT